MSDVSASAPDAITPESDARATRTNTLLNTYRMGVDAADLEGQPEMVKRVLMLANGRRKDLATAQVPRAAFSVGKRGLVSFSNSKSCRAVGAAPLVITTVARY